MTTNAHSHLSQKDTSPAEGQPETVSLAVWRTHFTTNATLGALYINGQFFCHTLEPRTRPSGAPKIPGKTAIPEGRYRLRLDLVSPRFSNFSRYPWARPWGGKLPFLCNVPGFSGILIHVGNTPFDTAGCLLVGEAKTSECILNSVATFRRLMMRLWRHPRHIPIYKCAQSPQSTTSARGA